MNGLFSTWWTLHYKNDYIFTFLHMKTITDNYFKKSKLFSNKTFTISIIFLSLLNDLE